MPPPTGCINRQVGCLVSFSTSYGLLRELVGCAKGAHWVCLEFAQGPIRALSPALAVKFNISPGRWQHFPLWTLFLQRDKGKRTEMTGTQHVGTLKT
jgi:hypothetical protein